MNLRPLHDQVVVKRTKPDEFEGSIFLPNAEGRISIFADVIAAGPESSVAAGDRVVLHGWAGKPLYIEGDQLLCVKDGDIVSVVE